MCDVFVKSCKKGSKINFSSVDEKVTLRVSILVSTEKYKQENSDFVPGKFWPEPRYLDSWQKKGWFQKAVEK